MFGGAERLRLQADVFYAPPWYVTSDSVRSLSIHDLGGRVSASFLKPALWGSRNDLLLDALGEKVSTSGVGFVGYQAEDADATGGDTPPVQPEFLDSGGNRRPDWRRHGFARTRQLHAGRRAGLRQLRHDRQQARSDDRRPAQRLRRGLWRIFRLDPQSRAVQGARLDLLLDRPGLALRPRRPRRARRRRGARPRRDPGQLALLRRRRRLGARLRL